MSIDSKHPLASKTIWGAIVTIAALAANYFKVDLGGSEEEWVNAVVGLIGSILVVVGRFTAVKRIK